MIIKLNGVLILNRNLFKLSFERVRASDGSIHTVGTVPSKPLKKPSLKKLAVLATALGVSVAFLRSPKGQQFLQQHFKVKVGDKQVFPPEHSKKVLPKSGLKKGQKPKIELAKEKTNLKFWDTIARNDFNRSLTNREKNLLNGLVEKMEGNFPEGADSYDIHIAGGTKEQRLLDFMKKYANSSPQEIRKAFRNAERDLRTGHYSGIGGKQRAKNRKTILNFLCTSDGRIILEALK